MLVIAKVCSIFEVLVFANKRLNFSHTSECGRVEKLLDVIEKTRSIGAEVAEMLGWGEGLLVAWAKTNTGEVKTTRLSKILHIRISFVFIVRS